MKVYHDLSRSRRRSCRSGGTSFFRGPTCLDCLPLPRHLHSLLLPHTLSTSPWCRLPSRRRHPTFRPRPHPSATSTPARAPRPFAGLAPGAGDSFPRPPLAPTAGEPDRSQPWQPRAGGPPAVRATGTRARCSWTSGPQFAPWPGDDDLDRCRALQPRAVRRDGARCWLSPSAVVAPPPGPLPRLLSTQALSAQGADGSDSRPEPAKYLPAPLRTQASSSHHHDPDMLRAPACPSDLLIVPERHGAMRSTHSYLETATILVLAASRGRHRPVYDPRPRPRGSPVRTRTCLTTPAPTMAASRSSSVPWR